MASLVLLSYTDTSGTISSLYLSGAGQSYTGSGTPWTAQATSPYELANNPTTGLGWSATPPAPALVLSGTPPFAQGATLAYRGYANVEEVIPIQMRANSTDNAIHLLNFLRRALSTGLTTSHLTLIVRWDGATNNSIYEVVTATLQEDPAFVHSEAGASPRTIRATLRLIRRPLGNGGSTTINNASTMNNSGTTSPTNLRAYGVGLGDTVYEGAPMNLLIDSGATAWTRMYLAAARGRAYSTTGAATYTTSSTSGAVGADVVTTDATVYLGQRNVRLRLLVHASVASNAQFRLEVKLAGGTQALYTSPWISSTGAVAQLIDCGAIAIDALRRNFWLSAQTLSVSIRYRSTNGASAATVVTSWQFLYYYDFAILNPSYANGFSATAVVVDAFDYSSSAAARSPKAYAYNGGGGGATDVIDARGTLPRYYAGCSLFCAYLTGTTGLYTVTNTMTATMQALREYHTLRGGSL